MEFILVTRNGTSYSLDYTSYTSGSETIGYYTRDNIILPLDWANTNLPYSLVIFYTNGVTVSNTGTIKYECNDNP